MVRTLSPNAHFLSERQECGSFRWLQEALLLLPWKWRNSDHSRRIARVVRSVEGNYSLSDWKKTAKELGEETGEVATCRNGEIAIAGRR